MVSVMIRVSLVSAIVWRPVNYIRPTSLIYKSSAVAEIGDRGHDRHGPKRGGCCAPFAESWDPV